MSGQPKYPRALDHPPPSTPSGTRRTVGDAHFGDPIESILHNYLHQPTAPAMRAITGTALPSRAPPAIDRAVDPGYDHDSDDDEPVTGRWELDELSDPRQLVRDRAVLVRLDGDTSGALVSVPREAATIGRSSRAFVHLTDVGVSRRHARIVYEYGSYHIEDLDSKNGTFVAGRAVGRAELRDGDLVQIGPRASFRFQLMDRTHEDVLRRLYDSSVYDQLTGIYNRRHFDQRLSSEIAFAVRHGTEVSLVLFDIDFFKRVNDDYGHLAGDHVLKEVAAAAGSQLRAEDVLARYGGEEFAVILRDTPLPGSERAAERIRTVVANTTIDIGGLRLGVTVSAGCAALSCCSANTASQLIDQADRRLYRAKSAGRNRVCAG